MWTCRQNLSRAIAAAVLLAIASMEPALGAPAQAPGSNTGDGSTPFTGLAQAPEANLFAGSASTEIPIVVPPGRQGLTPKLALSYSSSAGASPYGYGWDLALGRIQRSTKSGAVRCGAEPAEMVLQLPSANVECVLDANQRCLPHVEESFLRIEYRPASDSWEVWDKSGLHYFFGDEQLARQPVFLEAGCATFAWHLTHVEDQNGNYLHIAYSPWGESHYRYPETLVYGGNARAGLSPPFEVRFVWRTDHTCPDGRPASRPCDDRSINGMAGFPIALDRLLDRIDVRHAGANVRSYVMEYDADGAARVARQSFLRAVTLLDGSGHALARADGQPASTTFLYHDAGAAGFGFATASSVAKPALIASQRLRWTERRSSDSKTWRDVFDINGDAIPDLVEAPQECGTYTNTSWDPVRLDWKVYFGSANGFSDQPVTWSVMAPYQDLYLYCSPIRQSRSNSGGNVWSTIDTTDLNGDSIPDLVVASAWTASHPYWRVYLGTAPENGGEWGFAAGVDWYAPFSEFRWSQSDLHYIGWDGTGDLRDLIDINGDGLPDLVDAANTPWRVWYNNGSGFDSGNGTRFDTGWSLLRFTTEFGLQVAGFADVSGDGLPDQIHTWEHFGGAGYDANWQVRINVGGGVTAPSAWTVPASGCSWPTNHPWNGLRQAVWDNTDVVRDFFDINGDGLPDIVEACNTSASRPYWTVWLNRGSGFSSAQDWWSPFDRIRDLDDHTDNGGGQTFRDTFDLDGDGLVDFVDFTSDVAKLRVARNASGAWCTSSDTVSCNSTGSLLAANPSGNRPDLLVQMENGLGGSTFLEYRPSTEWDNSDTAGVPHLPWVQWTVTHIERDDGLCEPFGDAACTPSSQHSVAAEIDYAYGRYAPVAREFRGFRSVRQTDAAGNVQLSFFHQDAARRGRREASSRHAQGDALLMYDTSRWECLDIAAAQCAGETNRCPPMECPFDLPPAARTWTRLSQTLHYDTSDYVIRKVSSLTNLEWDRYGNVLRSSRGGSSTRSVETRSTFEYHDAEGRYQVDRAASSEVVESSDTAGPQRLSATWYAYDARGNLTATWHWLDQVVDPALPRGEACPTSGNCTKLEMLYDIYGNVVTVVDANGHRTSTTYDATTRTYPVTVTNALNQIVRTTYDPRCGALLSKTNLYASYDEAYTHPAAQYEYDSYCRLVSVHRPGESPLHPQVHYMHLPGKPGAPTLLVTQTLVSSTRPATRVDLFDAMGRRLQTQRDAVVDGKRRILVEGTTLYDGLGRWSRTYAPFTVTQSTGNYIGPPAGVGSSDVEYDALDRVVASRDFDGAQRTFEHNIAWQTTTRNACASSGNCAAGVVVETRDAFGRAVTTTAWSSGAFANATQRSYDGLGRLRSIVQAAAAGQWAPQTRVDFAYDSLSRRILVDDPDSGRWRYGYDLIGNAIFIDDPTAGQHVRYCYDAVDRRTDKYYGNTDTFVADCAARGDISYTYDRYDGAGGFDDGFDPRTAIGKLTQVDDTSGHSATFYDALGRTKLQVTSIVPPDASPSTAAISYEHDGADHVTAITYPDGERVKYFFDSAGQTRSIRGTKSYVRKLTYDVFGRPRELKHGNATSDSWTYGNANSNHRLAMREIKRGTATLLRQSYSRYSADGFLEAIDDLGPSGSSAALSRSAAMEYDGVGRLTACRDANQPTAERFAYDSLGNLTQHGSLQLAYQTDKPHTLATMNDGDQTITHDRNGNRRSKPGFVYEYDRDNHLVSINNDAVRFLYNHTGERVAAGREQNWRRYFGALAEAGDGYLTKYYYAGALLVASQRVPNLELSQPNTATAIHVVAAPRGLPWPALQIRLRRDVAALLSVCLCIAAAGMGFLPLRRRRRVGITLHPSLALCVVCVWFCASLPLPIVLRPAEAQLATREIRHFHLDHLGSTQMVTDSSGRVVLQLQYGPYGNVRGYFDANGNRLAGAQCGAGQSCREFTGYDSEPLSGLQYAGARFYDPQLGLFLTHDPARQFANPYAYAGWNPTNRTDSNGAFVEELVVAAVIAAVVSAAVNTVVAAAQGSSLAQIGKAAAAGAISGAVSVGIGVVASGLSISLAAAAGSLPQNVGMQQALNALGEVAYRSAVSGTIAQATGEVARAAGASDAASSGLSAAAGYLGSWGYDAWAIDYSGDLAKIEANGAFRNVSNTRTHDGITGKAARVAGFNDSQTGEIIESNLAQDGPFLGTRHLNNESHFGFGAAKAFGGFDAQVGGLDSLANIGAASHYLQDQYALGHVLPGTHLLQGPVGAPLRVLIHQSVGGEVNFFRMAAGLRIPSSFDATVDYFSAARARMPTGSQI